MNNVESGGFTPEDAQAFDPEQIAEDFRAFSAQAAAVDAMHSVLVKEHPNQWVAINDGEFVGASKDFDQIFEIMEQKRIDPKVTIVKFISTNPRPQNVSTYS